jgi:hypothetical protein
MLNQKMPKGILKNIWSRRNHVFNGSEVHARGYDRRN